MNVGFTHEAIDADGNGTDYTPVILPEEVAKKVLASTASKSEMKTIESILCNMCRLKGRTYIKGSITNVELD